MNCVEYFIEQSIEKDAQIDFHFIKIYCTVFIFICSKFCPDTNAHLLNVNNVQKKEKRASVTEFLNVAGTAGSARAHFFMTCEV